MSNHAEALARAGRQLQEEARAHKRSAEYHRDRARKLMAELAALVHECERLGIDIHIAAPIPARPGTARPHTDPQGGQSASITTHPSR